VSGSTGKPGPFACWLYAIRPKTLFAAIIPVLMGSAVAFRDGGYDSKVVLLILTCAICIQIGTNLANDYWDWKKGADTEKRIGPPRVTSLGWIAPAKVYRATLLFFGLAGLTGLFLVAAGGWPIFWIGAASLICGFAYTAGPFPLAYLGLGEIFVLLFFGPVASGGTYYLLTRDWSPASLLVGLGAGLYSTALLVVNNLRDRKGDSGAGKKTLAVRFGATFARSEFAVCLIAPGMVFAFAGWLEGISTLWLSMLLIGPLMLALPLVRTLNRLPEGPELNALLARVGRVSLLATSLVCATWIFHP
jgi:1,4-dihydroxy-2-naphthoate octaprenyltransferase